MVPAWAAMALGFATMGKSPEEEKWLIAATGTCSSLVVSEQSIIGEDGAHYIAKVEFKFDTKSAIIFNDYLYHKSFVMQSVGGRQARELASSTWDHKNIAVLTPVPRDPNGGCTDPVDLNWATAVFEVEEHGLCEGEDDDKECVHYRGFVSSKTHNFPSARAGDFACQLFVDTEYDDKDDDLPNGAGCYTCYSCNDDPRCASGECKVNWREDMCTYIFGIPTSNPNCYACGRTECEANFRPYDCCEDGGDPEKCGCEKQISANGDIGYACNDAHCPDHEKCKPL